MIERRPIVSVIIRTCQRPEFLKECLASVAAQDYSDIQTVLVWNGGPRHSVQAPNLTEVNLCGSALGAAMNAGIGAAVGDYLYVLDDDDVLLPGALSKSVALAEDTGADLVFCNLWLFSDTGRNIGMLRTRVQTFEQCLENKQIPHASSMYRRKFLDENSLRYDPTYENAEDYDFILAFLRHKPVVCKLDELLYKYRVHKDQQRNNPREAQNGQRIRIKWRTIAGIGQQFNDLPADGRAGESSGAAARGTSSI